MIIFTEKEIYPVIQADLDKVDGDSEISLIEQEICFLVDFFLYSDPSTWSMNVNLERAVAGRNDNLLNLHFQIDEENCDLEIRLGEKNEFAVLPFVSFPGSGNT